MIPPLRESQQHFIRQAFPETGDIWVRNYPALLQKCIDRWSLTHLERAEGGYPTNVVFFAEQPDGLRVVLKTGHPHTELFTEAVALRAYAGGHTPELIDHDPDLPAMLMARVAPGEMLRQHSQRNLFDGEIFAKLGWPCDRFEGLPTYQSWVQQAFAEFRERFDANNPLMAHVRRAEDLFAAIDSESWFLHGDLHHENLLWDEDRGWIAIDPKGVIGSRLMECGRFLHNFLEDEVDGAGTVDGMARIVAARCERLAPVMDCRPQELANVGYVDVVLSTCWTANERAVAVVTPTLSAMAKLVA